VIELEILRRRRELVLLSAQLQRATVVRRLEHVNRHSVHAVLGLATTALSVPILLKIGSVVLKFVPVLKIFPVLKSLNR
jgi:hypothetical protein